MAVLGDSEINALEGQLGAIVRGSQRHHDDLQSLLQQFQSLLESYNRLKSDYEEEKEAREKYKKLARGQDRSPFALVLVDGDGYLFRDDLIKAGAEGGITAAALLSDAIKDLLHDQLGTQAEQCRIMVRIYSNMLGLSKTLARSGLVGHEARSISPFAASFTRSRDLFDYIDAGDKKEGADFKIREMFRLFADNNQCKHIFFAGCHDTGYLSLLTPYLGKSDRVTLLKATSFHTEFENLGLPVREIPDVFNSSSGVAISSQLPAPSRPVCKHFQKGICRFGSDCNKLHIPSNQQLSKHKPTDNAPTKLWSPITPREQGYYAQYLPRINSKSQYFIAVNDENERLDTYCPMPSPDAWDAYTRRARRHKICNKYQLGGECGNLSCEYDHSPVESTIVSVMRFIMRQYSCPKGGRCRSLKCYLGHLCQKDSCKGCKPCKFDRHAHSLNIRFSQWVTPIEHEEDHATSASPVSEDSLEVNSVNSNSDPNNTFSYLMEDVV
ncbi:hypothetical protein BDV59DRAFT_164990 [Aspergillus ambiguus]|uniref:zinc finger CCCH domain-containing protein n=1 Tax=Aspergillus ambiguus TaxID=176160 RepID=UPI003CCE0FDB